MSKHHKTAWSWRNSQQCYVYDQIAADSAKRRGFLRGTRGRGAMCRRLLIITLSAAFFALNAVNEAAATHKRFDGEDGCVQRSGGTRCNHQGSFLVSPPRMERLIDGLESSGSSCHDSNEIAGAVECVQRSPQGWGVKNIRPLDD